MCVRLYVCVCVSVCVCEIERERDLTLKCVKRFSASAVVKMCFHFVNLISLAKCRSEIANFLTRIRSFEN